MIHVIGDSHVNIFYKKNGSLTPDGEPHIGDYKNFTVYCLTPLPILNPPLFLNTDDNLNYMIGSMSEYYKIIKTFGRGINHIAHVLHIPCINLLDYYFDNNFYRKPNEYIDWCHTKSEPFYSKALPLIIKAFKLEEEDFK